MLFRSSVKDFLQASFNFVDLNYEDYLEIDPDLYRPAEVDYLKSDPTKAIRTLGWSPSISFNELVSDMVQSDIELYRHINA